jgi:hypothetical protein
MPQSIEAKLVPLRQIAKNACEGDYLVLSAFQLSEESIIHSLFVQFALKCRPL